MHDEARENWKAIGVAVAQQNAGRRRRRLEEAAWFVFGATIGVLVVALLGALFGCASGSAASTLRESAAYKLEGLACVRAAKTVDQSEACRCEVDRRYGLPCVPAYRPVDGGADR